MYEAGNGGVYVRVPEVFPRERERERVVMGGEGHVYGCFARQYFVCRSCVLRVNQYRPVPLLYIYIPPFHPPTVTASHRENKEMSKRAVLRT